VKAKLLAHLLLWTLLLAVVRPAYAEYRTVEIESLKITIDSDWVQQSAPGFFPVRFDIINTGEARVIDIIGQDSRWSRFSRTGPANVDIRRTLRLNRGDRVHLTISTPVMAQNDSIRFQIIERGRVLEQFNSTSVQSNQAPEASGALIVANASDGLGVAAAAWPREAPSSPVYGYVAPGSRPRTPKLDVLIEPSRIPSEWAAYASLRAVLIGPKEWELLQELQRNALLSWTAAGGDLMFVDGDWKALFPGKPEPAETIEVAGGPSHRYFFGRVYFPKTEQVSAMELQTVFAAAREAVRDPSWSLPANRAGDWAMMQTHGFRLPIPGVNGVPAHAYLWILVLFSLLIGPANYTLLWRRRQQVLFVLTAPLVSTVFIALLAAYSVFGEGFGVRARADTFTILDQTTKRAATRASISLYAAGMTPSGGLAFPREMAIIPLGTDGLGMQSNTTVDLSDSLRFSSGLIEARSPVNFEQIAFSSARERLQLTRDGDRVRVANGLGGDVQLLAYRESGSTFVLKGRLTDGGTAVLERGAPLHLPGKFRSVAETQPDGSYIAVMDRSPFWDPGAPKVDERGSFHVVLGYPGVEP
jgi:hypothetical protein